MDKQSLWRPFTPMADWLRRDPLIIHSGQGSLLRDIEGREYIDGCASLWCNALGHRRPEVDAAVREQLDLIAHSTQLGLAHPQPILLADRLVRIAPAGLKKVFFSGDGASAVEAALKMAFQFWSQNGQPQRRLFVSLQNAYHGDTLGSVSVGGIDLFHETYRPLLFGAVHVPSPFCYRCPLGLRRAACGMACLRKAQDIIASRAQEIAAVIVEPMVQGAAGMIVMPPGYLKGIETACRGAGALLIADEVATGFGRTGRMFACQWEDVRPDLLTVGKALTNGYLPVSATLATQRVFDGFLGPGQTFYHGHTFSGNPLGCAAANATLDAMKAERIPESLAPRIALLQERLEAMRGLPHVGDVRGKGLMAGVEIVRDPATGQPFDPALRLGARLCDAMRPRGVILRPLGDVLVVMPPLTIPLDLLSRLMDVIEETIRHDAPRLARENP